MSPSQKSPSRSNNAASDSAAPSRTATGVVVWVISLLSEAFHQAQESTFFVSHFRVKFSRLTKRPSSVTSCDDIIWIVLRRNVRVMQTRLEGMRPSLVAEGKDSHSVSGCDWRPKVRGGLPLGQTHSAFRPAGRSYRGARRSGASDEAARHSAVLIRSSGVPAHVRFPSFGRFRPSRSDGSPPQRVSKMAARPAPIDQSVLKISPQFVRGRPQRPRSRTCSGVCSQRGAKE